MRKFYLIITLFIVNGHSLVYGQAEVINEGHFVYDILEVKLNTDEIFSPSDSTILVNRLANSFKKEIYFKNGWLAIAQNMGMYQLRTVMAEELDSVYLFMNGFGETTCSVYSKTDFKSKAESALAGAKSNSEVDTISNEAIGVNDDGLELYEMILMDSDVELNFEYANNLAIYKLIPLHSIPYLLDKILTKFDLSVQDGTIIFGIKEFKEGIENDDIFNVNTTGLTRKS